MEDDKKKRQERETKEKKTAIPQRKNNNEELATTLGKMVLILNATNATLNQKIEFIQLTEELTANLNCKH